MKEIGALIGFLAVPVGDWLAGKDGLWAVVHGQTPRRLRMPHDRAHQHQAPADSRLLGVFSEPPYYSGIITSL